MRTTGSPGDPGKRGPAETAYPFEDEVRLTVSCDRPAAFPLYLRLPGWSKGVSIAVNGAPVDGDLRGGRYAVLRRTPPYQPFSGEGAPIVLRARARRVPAWKEEGRMVGPVPASPAAAEGPAEEIALIPMGCARLRITTFPLVKD